MITFAIGPLLMVISYFVLRGYPVTRESLRDLEKSIAPRCGA